MDMEFTRESIKLSSLTGISILFENDLYDLACFMIKTHRSQDEEANRKSSRAHQTTSSTLLALAHKYAYLTNVPSDIVKMKLREAGLSLDAIVKDAP